MLIETNAKVNLDLRVGRLQPNGLHDLRSLMLSITWSDRIVIEVSDADEFAVLGPAPQGDDNLAVRARDAVRAACGRTRPIRIELTKRIPVAAGLGGGSADAAGVLMAASHLWGCDPALPARLAPDLGSDVPFCLVGGLANVGGTGASVERMPTVPDDFAIAVVVPPVEVSTAAVYGQWDRMDGPHGEPVARGLPPSLRSHAPLRNDLAPAATALAPVIAEWKGELRHVWSRPVLLSGSGPSLFAFFADADEAEHALGVIPTGARQAEVVAPAPKGVSERSGTLP